MSAEAQSSPPVVPLTFLVLVNAALMAVRDVLSAIVDVDRLSYLVLAGEVSAVRAILSPFASAAATPPPAAYKAAAASVLAVLDAAVELGPERPARRFHGELALKGHRDLGMCLVEEQRLGGVQVIRCTRLCVDPPEVHWTRADNVYDLREVHEDEALAAAARAAAKRELERREQEDDAARQRERRGKATVDVQRRGQFVHVTARVNGYPEPGLLVDGPVARALRDASVDVRRRYDNGRCLGYVAAFLSADDAEQAATLGSPLCEALASAGFLSVMVVPPGDPEGDESEGDDSDAEAF